MINPELFLLCFLIIWLLIGLTIVARIHYENYLKFKAREVVFFVIMSVVFGPILLILLVLNAKSVKFHGFL